MPSSFEIRTVRLAALIAPPDGQSHNLRLWSQKSRYPGLTVPYKVAS